VFWDLDENQDPVSPRSDVVAEVLGNAFEAYAATTDSPTGAGFAAFVRARGGAAASEFEGLSRLFAEISALGLTKRERDVSYRVLLAPISGFGLPTVELIEALQSSETGNALALSQ
jgi:hypothetical protein